MTDVARPKWVSRYEFALLVRNYGGKLILAGNGALLSRPDWVSIYEFRRLVDAYNGWTNG